MASNVFSMRIVDSHLNNSKCKCGVMYKPWREAWQGKGVDRESHSYEYIIAHYTVCKDFRSTRAAYEGAGVSAHYTIENDGTINLTVDPEKYIAFHAGPSAFDDRESLNYYSIGIENINPGFTNEYEEIPPFGPPIRISGDQRWWFPFDERQFTASMTLARCLHDKYRIPSWNFVTHADVAVGRKSDVGPMWDYERAFREFGVGYFPEETHQVVFDHFGKFIDSDYIDFIGAFGYRLPAGVGVADMVRAYQMHYSRMDISGELSQPTKINILKHVVGLAGYVDPYTHESYGRFHSLLRQWAIKNPDKALTFEEYCDITQ
jgi:N-acetylmuramoyl-L-alanine amidase